MKSFNALVVLLSMLTEMLPANHGLLLYPEFTVFQVIGSLSVPINDLLRPYTKVFFDWGFQMNYAMPFNLSEFYMQPIWPQTTRSISFLSIYSNRSIINNKNDFNWLEESKYLLKRYKFSTKCLTLIETDIKSDFVFNDFYQKSENFLNILLELLRCFTKQHFLKLENKL